MTQTNRLQFKPAGLGAALLLCLLTACGRSEAPAPATPAPAAVPTAPAAAPAPVSTATVFEGARLIIGDGSDPVENGVLVVDDAEIVAAGPAGTIDIPEGATRVDLSGATVMPAIIDTHVHLSREREPLIADLQNRARFGVAAAMSLGQDNNDIPFAVRGETIPGAALYRTAGRGISRPEPGRPELAHWVSTVEEARAAVQTEAARDVDIIKIWVDDRDGQYDKLTPEFYGAIIDEAHMNDLRVTAHIFTLEDAKGLLQAGVDSFAHGVRDMDVDEEVMTMLRERPDVVLVPNLPGRGVATDLSWLSGSIPDAQLQQLQAAATASPAAQEAFAIQARNLARMNDAGVKIALGTDGNTPWGPHLEMEDMVAAGMTPAEVLVAATRNGAEFMELDAMGTLESGNSADFIVLDANPLDDITNTRRIRAVYLRGERVDRE